MTALRRAIVATFERRNTPVPKGEPAAWTKAFLTGREKTKLWKAFLNRIRLPDSHAELSEVGTAIREFLKPVLDSNDAASNGVEWPPGGPWRKL